MYFENEFIIDKKQLKISLFNDFYLESIYIENKIFIALINDILDLLKVKHENVNLCDLQSLFKSFIIINDDQFLDNHFRDICMELEKWDKEYQSIFERFNNLNVNELKLLSKNGNIIIKKLENNIEILKKYLEE